MPRAQGVQGLHYSVREEAMSLLAFTTTIEYHSHFIHPYFGNLSLYGDQSSGIHFMNLHVMFFGRVS